MKTEDYRKSLLKRLKNPDYAVGYLTDVLVSQTQEEFLIALRDVIEAREENFSAISETIGVTRQGLYQALSKEGNPRLSTITQILSSLGMKFVVEQSKRN